MSTEEVCTDCWGCEKCLDECDSLPNSPIPRANAVSPEPVSEWCMCDDYCEGCEKCLNECDRLPNSPIPRANATDASPEDMCTCVNCMCGKRKCWICGSGEVPKDYEPCKIHGSCHYGFVGKITPATIMSYFAENSYPKKQTKTINYRPSYEQLLTKFKSPQNQKFIGPLFVFEDTVIPPPEEMWTPTQKN